jgi:hypothetical protein
MQVSHESPLALLDKSRSYNDYDYCLVHLLPQYPQYLQFFKDSKKMGRKILLDNSMFELREAFDADKFAEWIEVIKPDEYIVPDVFSDAQSTIKSFDLWIKKYKDLPGKMIGVVQGTTYQEIADCYKYMARNANKIAFSFECPLFRSMGYTTDVNSSIWERLASGRQRVIRSLIDDNIWAWGVPVHLLGCAIPQEFKYYKQTRRLGNSYLNIYNIESIDTSNPVVAGMHNMMYNDYGLKDKITTKLADMLEHPVTDNQWNIISHNIKKFRNINNIDRS